MTDDELWESIAGYYLNSRDFNGLPLRTIDIPLGVLKKALARLVKNGDVSLMFSEFDMNTYVKRLQPQSVIRQLEYLNKVKDITHTVAYPEGERLRRYAKPQKYSEKPYSLIVARGKPLLECAFFKLDVLERFRNDPRYYYHFNDAGGAVYARNENMGKDEVYVKSIGIAYDEDMNRAVCVFHGDLAEMSKDQQQYWKYFELQGSYSPHPDFIWSQVYGQWPERSSLPEAFTAELQAINLYTTDCFGKKLFKHEYLHDKRPKELAFLLRPTLKELNGFIHIVDKLISDNINTKFFAGVIDLEAETLRSDGRVAVTRKATLTLLEEFIRGQFKPGKDSQAPMDEMFDTFKKIRKLRTKPAHSVEEDVFDQEYFKEQRALFIEAYKALRMLRLIFQNHPQADRNKIPDWLYEGKINTL
ncbi:MAG: hypothetical protein WAT31_02815 [Candidatus Saccharimonas aalborgensis]